MSAGDRTALVFEQQAHRYEAWYETAKGQRVDREERDLIGSLLEPIGSLDSVLEIGCGTGHFLSVLAGNSPSVYGLDRSASMLKALRELGRDTPIVCGDARALPFRSRSVSLSALVTTLEFVPDRQRTLAEAVRVARQGVLIVALNRISLGGLTRRFNPSPILSRAHDFRRSELEELLRAAAGERLEQLHMRMALSPAGHWLRPFGDVIGVVASLRDA
jgi:ubiquinone/menaquinone biosynthesis C-methylase UbiE